MSRGSNEIAAIKMMPVYMPWVLGSRAGRGYKASSGFAHRHGARYMIHCSAQHISEAFLINPIYGIERNGKGQCIVFPGQSDGSGDNSWQICFVLPSRGTREGTLIPAFSE